MGAYPTSHDVLVYISIIATEYDEYKILIQTNIRIYSYHAVSGFFQVLLSESSWMLTATILPSGRYVYLSPPMGMSPSGDFYNQ